MRSLFRIASIVALTVIGCAVAQADLYSATEAYKAKDYQKAFTEFRELAELGNPQSQFVLGPLYFNGHGVTQNRLVGYGWVRLAADAGHEQARELEPKLRAEIDEENVDRARGLLSKFSPDALASRIYPKVLENCEFQEDIVPPKLDRKRTGNIDLPDFPQMGEGSVVVELMIAEDGTVRDTRVLYALSKDALEKIALEYGYRFKFEPATLNGKPIPGTFQLRFGHSNLDDKYLKQVDGKVKQILRKAEQGDMSSQYKYGLILTSLRQYNRPWGEALPWFIKSAQGGFADAQYIVGQSLLRGHGCEKDLVKAREWLTLAAQQDFPDAQIELARLSLKVGPYYEPEKAIFWLESAAKNDSIKGKKYLASILAASQIEKLRDPKRAQTLVEEVLKSEPSDVVSLETKAAAMAATGDFDQAIAIEQAALKSATKKGWNTKDLEERLAGYNQKQPWYGDLLTF